MVSNNPSPQAFIRTIGAWLRLNTVTISTALVYYHRFESFQLNNDLIDPRDDAGKYVFPTACVYIATKATDCPRKVRDLLSASFKAANPTHEFLAVNHDFWKFKSLLLNTEMVLLRILKFRFFVDLPFTYITDIVNLIFASSITLAPPFVLSQNVVVDDPGVHYTTPTLLHADSTYPHLVWNLAWTLAFDATLDPNVVLHHPMYIAIVSIYVALVFVSSQDPTPNRSLLPNNYDSTIPTLRDLASHFNCEYSKTCDTLKWLTSLDLDMDRLRSPYA